MTTKEKDEDILKLARERFSRAYEAEVDIRREAKRDLEFLAGEQWTPAEKKEREDNGRPALVINKLPQFVDQVVNEQRKSRPGASVSPVGDGSDPDTADICEGMIRHIDHASNAEVAYDTAFEYSGSCSFGFWRYTTEYVDDESFDQEIKVVAVPDPFAVYIDPGAILADRSDMRWSFVVETLSREEFKRRYPKSDTVTAEFWDLASEGPAPDWVRKDGVRVAEYWTIESERRTLCMYSDGIARWEGDADAPPVPPGVTSIKERTSERRTVKQYVLNGAEILERSDWAGKWIPIVPVYGKQLIVDGQRKLFSLIRFARDPQQLYNYYKTSQAEAVGLSPKAPYIGAVGQFRTKGGDWATANTIPYSYLEYDVVVAPNGEPLPAPARNTYEPPIQALSLGALQASDDIKATTGIFDPSLGANKGDQSGEAIRALQNEGNTANFHLVDNLTRSLWHGYRIVLDLLPKIYDTARAVRIIKPDHESELVQINQMFLDAKTGKPKQHDLSLGRYDITMSVGPDYETRRAETRDHLVDLAKADPQSIPQWADLYVKQLDLGPIGDQIAERLTPPQFRNDADPHAQMMQAQSKLQQAGQMIDQLTGTVHQLQNEIDAKVYECQSRELIAAMQEETKRSLGLAAIDQKDGIALLMQEIAALKQRQGMVAQAHLQAGDQQHQQEQQQQDQQHQQQMAAQDRAHQAGLQAMAHGNQQELQLQQAQQQAADQQAQQQQQDAQPEAA